MCLSRNAGTLVAILLVFAGQARFSCGLTTLSPGPGTGPGTQLEMGAYLLTEWRDHGTREPPAPATQRPEAQAHLQKAGEGSRAWGSRRPQHSRARHSAFTPCRGFRLTAPSGPS